MNSFSSLKNCCLIRCSQGALSVVVQLLSVLSFNPIEHKNVNREEEGRQTLRAMRMGENSLQILKKEQKTFAFLSNHFYRSLKTQNKWNEELKEFLLKAKATLGLFLFVYFSRCRTIKLFFTCFALVVDLKDFLLFCCGSSDLTCSYLQVLCLCDFFFL